MGITEGWAEEVWKHIESEFEGVKNKNPPGQTEGATGQAFSADKVLSALKLGSFEIRNVCCNLAWTLPLYESIEGDTTSIALIEKYARAKFWSQEEDKPTAPALWPSVTIPIAFMQREELPPKTTWARYGGDIAAAAFWYAFAAAKKAGQPDHELEAFRRLCRNVPMTFKFFPTEPARFAEACRICDEVEHGREFFGLDCARLMAVVQRASRICEAELAHKTSKISHEHISEWLSKNVKWVDPKRCPSANTVRNILTIVASIGRSQRAKAAMELARVQLGRACMWDEYSKVLIPCQRALNSEELDFAVEYLTMRMLRSIESANPSVNELKSKCGDLSMAFFSKKYADELWGHLGQIIGKQDASTTLEKAKALFFRPLAMHQEFPKGQAGSLTWMTGLPKAVAVALQHWREFVFDGTFNQDVKGLLSSPPAGGATAAHARETENLKKFWASFDILLKEESGEVDAEGAATSEAAGGDAAASTQGSKDTVAKLSEDVKQRAQESLSQRLIVIEQSAPAASGLVDLLRAQELCSSKEVRMGFWDPKNAVVPKAYPSQNKFQRVPVAPEAELEAFCKAMDALMEPARDVCFIMSGKTKTSEDLIFKVTGKLKWNSKTFYLHYCPKAMHELGYWKVMRGLGNAGTAEKLFLFWKGQVPKQYAKARMYVDANSRTYVESMLRVPVATAKELSLVPRATWEAWTKSDQCESVVVEAAGSDDEESKQSDTEVEAKLKRRRYSKRGTALGRQPSTDETLLFPFDNSGLLMKELLHESGARWMLHGTPALGSGIYGAFELNIPTIAIVKTNLHKVELERALVQRLVADIPIAGNSLCIAEMNRRAEALGITKPAAKSGAKRKGGPAVEEPSDSDDFETPKKEKDDQVQPKSSEKTKEKKGKKEKGDKKEKNDKKDKDKEKEKNQELVKLRLHGI